MPQLGETVTEGTITKWHKAVGDAIKEDEVLFEVSTDKVDSEVPSPVAGFVAEILVAEGDTVDVGVRLAVISAEAPAGDSPAAAPAAGAEPQPVSQPIAEPVSEPDTAPPEPASPQADEVPASPPTPSGPPSPSAGSRPTDNRPASGSGTTLSPVVRKLITEHGLDPSSISGTGAGGRITRDDVLALIDAQAAGGPPAAGAPGAAGVPASTGAAPVAAVAPVAPAGPSPSARPAPLPAAKPGEQDQVIPFSRIRRVTAEHMVRSLATSAHTLVAIEVDYAGVEKVRSAMKASFKAEQGISLTYLPFISRATVDALREFPLLNASVGNDELIVHRYLNLGIAVDLNFEGLLVPVIHDADGKRLRAIAREIADLAGRARSKRLTADDISGGTFTITNAGPFGTLLTYAVINQPQVAILSTDGVKKRPVVVEMPDGSDVIGIHPTGNLSLSFDHRANDGAYAAAFLARVKEILETRDWSAEL